MERQRREAEYARFIYEHQRQTLEIERQARWIDDEQRVLEEMMRREPETNEDNRIRQIDDQQHVRQSIERARERLIQIIVHDRHLQRQIREYEREAEEHRQEETRERERQIREQQRQTERLERQRQILEQLPENEREEALERINLREMINRMLEHATGDDREYLIEQLRRIQILEERLETHQRELRRREQPQIIEPAGSGIAFEVHNAFNEFKFDNFIKIITEKNETNKASINNDDPLAPLIEYMSSNKISQDKITQLTTIKTTLDSFSKFKSHKKDIANVIKYVISQSTEFINIYIDNFIQDCLHAYSSNNSASCTKGMYERIFTVFRDVISTLCTEEITGNSTAITTSTCKPEYIELFNCFYNIPSLNELFQEWYTAESSKNETVDKETRIERFKNFVKEKVPENKYNMILSKLEKYIKDNSSIFETMMLGGRKRGGGKPRISLSAAKKRKSKKKKSKKPQTRRMK